MDVSECAGLKRERTFFAHEIAAGMNIVPKVLKALTKTVYITIDLDVLDPSIMPSTGTPEPGGLDWYTLINLLSPVIAEKNVVGMDVTELLPHPDNKAPDLLAAKLIYRTLSMIFDR
jgi:agmatinase